MFLRSAVAVGAAVVLSLAPQAMAADAATRDKTIIQTAAGSEQFSSFVAAVKAAGLVDALSGDGPLTIFAPTDDAFAALPEGTIANLLKPENKQRLQSILKYHLVAGKYPAAKLRQVDALESLQGQSLQVKQSKQGVQVNQAKVVKIDILCSNGVIHLIDAVMLPSDQEATGDQ